MREKLLLAFVLMMLAGCLPNNSDNETQLLSEDNRHILYLFTDTETAEIYSGMTMIASFDISHAKENQYILTPTSGKYQKLGLELDPKTGKWHCKICKKRGLSTTWLQQ